MVLPRVRDSVRSLSRVTGMALVYLRGQKKIRICEFRNSFTHCPGRLRSLKVLLEVPAFALPRHFSQQRGVSAPLCREEQHSPEKAKRPPEVIQQDTD